MATAAQRAAVAASRATATSAPATTRIKSSVDRARSAAKREGREYRGPTPEQAAAGTLEVGTPTTAHREQARATALARTYTPQEVVDVRDIKTTKQISPHGVPLTTAQIHLRQKLYGGPVIVHQDIGLLQEQVRQQNLQLTSEASKFETVKAQEYLARQRLERAPIQDGVFVGTPEQYAQYQKDYEKHTEITDRLTTQYSTYSEQYEQQKQDIEKLESLETKKERGRMWGLRGVEMDIAEELPTFKDVVGATVTQVEKSPLLTKMFVGAAYASQITPSATIKTEAMGRLGEEIYEYPRTHLIETVAIAATAPLVMAGIGGAAVAGSAAARAVGVPIAASTIETGIGASFLATLGVTEYKHVTAPIMDIGPVGMPIYRDPTIPEMAGRVGESIVPISAFIIGAGLPKAIRSIDMPYSISPKYSIDVKTKQIEIPYGLTIEGTPITIPTGVKFKSRDMNVLSRSIRYPYGIGARYSEFNIPRGIGIKRAQFGLPKGVELKQSLPEGILIKGEIAVPKEIRVDTTALQPKGSIVDIVKYKEPQPPTTFIGKETTAGTREFFMEVPKGKEAEFLATYTGKIETIKAPQGKMLQVSEIEKVPELPQVEMLPGAKARTPLMERLPFEITRKVEMDPIDIRLGEVAQRQMITDYANTFDMGAPSTPTQRIVGLVEGRKTYLDIGVTQKPKDITQPFIRKDITEIPYKRDVQISIEQESMFMGRPLTKFERGMVREDIIKESDVFAFDVKPRPKYTPQTFMEVETGTRLKQIVKLKEPEIIPEVKVDMDFSFGEQLPSKVEPKAKAKRKVETKFEFKEDLKRPIFEEISKPKTKQRVRVVPVFKPSTAPTEQVKDKQTPKPFLKDMFKVSQKPSQLPSTRSALKTVPETMFKSKTLPKEELFKPPKTRTMFDMAKPELKIVEPPKIKLPKKTKTTPLIKKGKKGKKEYWEFENPIKSAEDMI